MTTLRSPLLHRRDVRVELLLLLGGQDRPQRRDLLLALMLHLRPNLGHLRARGCRVATLARGTDLLAHRVELLAVLGHGRLLILTDRLEPTLLRVGQVDAL